MKIELRNYTCTIYVPCQPKRGYGLDNIDNYMRNIVAIYTVIPYLVLYIPVLFI